jgi:hypothetical protein
MTFHVSQVLAHSVVRTWILKMKTILSLMIRKIPSKYLRDNDGHIYEPGYIESQWKKANAALDSIGEYRRTVMIEDARAAFPAAADYENPWINRSGEIFDEALIDQQKLIGFVYMLTCTVTGQKYIGKKLFKSRKTKQVKKKKKRYTVPSDWKDYYGSNEAFKELVKQHGKDSIKREILHLCTTKGWCNYLEMKEQCNHEVLESKDFLNDWIMVKVHRKHLISK